MKLSAILELLVDSGADTEALVRAVKKWEAEQADALQKRREADAARQAAKRLRDAESRDSRDVTVTVSSRDAGDARVEDNLQTKNQAGEKGKEEKDAPEARSFPEFWSLYPNKVGKRDAETAFLKALKRADIETILAGLRRYVAKTDDRPWCNPATWLNQDRWEDAPASVAPASRATAPPRDRTVSDVLGEIANGTWTGPQEPKREPDFPFIETSFSRRN